MVQKPNNENFSKIKSGQNLNQKWYLTERFWDKMNKSFIQEIPDWKFCSKI